MRIHEIADDQLLEANCALARIRAITDALMQIDEDSSASDSCSLMRHTIWNLADTILNQVTAIERFIEPVSKEDAA